MTIRTWHIKHVLWEDIARHLAIGWMFAEHCSHPTCSHWAVLMSWPCACPVPPARKG
jgi:hypothetical protein